MSDGVAKKTADAETDVAKAQKQFKISKEKLINLVQSYQTREFDEDIVDVEKLGGLEGIVAKIDSDSVKGLDMLDSLERAAHFGSNHRDPLFAESCCSMFYAALDDFMLKLLIVCAVVSITIDMSMAQNAEERSIAWIDGFAIMVAVLVVSGVGSIVDYRKEIEFVLRRNNADKTKLVDVTRNGKIEENVHHNELLVGDLIQLRYGMQIPVDGILVEKSSNLTADESAMTGESEELIKDTFNECMARKKEFDTSGKTTTITNTAGRRTALPSPIMMSGTSVAQGEGVMMAVMVGENSSLGKIIAKLADKDNEKTPLQIKLEEIAEDIGKLGTIFAIMTFHVLMLRFIFEGLVWSEIDLFSSESADKKGCNENGCFIKYLGDWFKFAIIGIVIIVVAVPEGLPLAVMISLAFAIGQMLNDDCAVKKLASCEIMGGANNICSDKTGTLTNNSMEVVSMYIGGKDITIPVKTAQDKLDLIKTDGLSAEHWKLISTSIACNVPPSHAGPTDLAMIELVTRHGEKEDCDKIRAEFHPAKEDFIRFSFTSIRKRMTTVTKGHGVDEYDRRAQIKGASEHVIKTCTHYIDSNGDRQTKNDEMSTQIVSQIRTYAKKALRTIAIGYKDLSHDAANPKFELPDGEPIKDMEKEGFTLLAILGIEDTVRSEVPQAVKDVQAAGVTVRMVTGDNVDTAKAIAVQCNIIKETDLTNPNVCMEGPEFYEKCGGLKTFRKNGKKKEEVRDFSKFCEIQKELVVMARCRPEDKYLMVTGLKQMGATVAVTGDGTNDAPALKKADVGFGMNKVGTDVCKEAADILLMEDDFSSIVKAAKWGRNIYDNIQRFLRFQLTVNFVALTVTFVGSCIMKQSPLNAIQLLWVNLIMDSLAALALATENPRDELLQREPQNRNDYLVSRRMVKHIMYGSIWQSIILMFFAFWAEYLVVETEPFWRYDWQENFSALPQAVEGVVCEADAVDCVPVEAVTANPAWNNNWNTRGNQWAIYPGRDYDWNGEPLFVQWKKGTFTEPSTPEYEKENEDGTKTIVPKSDVHSDDAECDNEELYNPTQRDYAAPSVAVEEPEADQTQPEAASEESVAADEERRLSAGGGGPEYIASVTNRCLNKKFREAGLFSNEEPLKDTHMGTDGLPTYYPQTDSRQFTFFFALFVLFQITNMLASRKIHDEFNIFSGICDNFVFIGVWIFIVVCQVVLTQFTSSVFEVHIEGLSFYQWLQAFLIALTQFLCDFLVKFIPDRFTPAMGADSVFNAREELAARPRCTKFDEKKGDDDDEEK